MPRREWRQQIMASFMKSKIAGLFRGLKRNNGDNPSLPPADSVAAPAAVPAFASASGAPEKPNAQSQTILAASANNAAASSFASGDWIEISLAPVLAALPMDLKAKMIGTPPPGKTILLPAETAVSQLAFGAVKISFGELRRLAPGVFAEAPGEHDSRAVNLPLQEILSHINAALLVRRSTQKVEVSDDIVGPFGERGHGVHFTRQTSQTASTPHSPPRQTQPVATPLKTAPVREIKPAQPIAFTPPELPASPPIAFNPRPTLPATPPIPFGTSKPSGGNSNGNGHGGNAALPPFKFSAAPVTPAPAQPTLPIPLNGLIESWPEEIKNEMAAGGFRTDKIELPLGAVESGLKRGRVTVKWKTMRTLLNANAAVSPNDELELILPLNVLAPAFLAAQKNAARPQTKVKVSQDIPNLFFGFPQPQPTAETPPSAPAPATTPLPNPVSLPKTPVPDEPRPVAVAATLHQPTPSRLGDTNYFTRDAADAATDTELRRRAASPATDFLNRQMHPKDVVAAAVKLPGVAGAVVAIADGLRVAGEVPPEVNVDMVAAFLPQIYDRVNQSARELRMGALNNISFTVGNVPWKIFRVSSVYFAAFGRAGQTLPKSQLVALAASLDRKNPS